MQPCLVLGAMRKEWAALRLTAAVCIRDQTLAKVGEGRLRRQIAGQDELKNTLPV